jgi:hypothetical protein
VVTGSRQAAPLRLYDKFGIFDQEGRRARLANEAIRRGAVSTAEILGKKPSGA